MARRRSKRKGARNSNQRFYSGRTTHTSSDQKKLRKQKDYRRQKLSKQKRVEWLQKARLKLRWVGAALAVLIIFNLLQIKSHQYVGLTGLTEGDKRVVTDLTDDFISGMNRFKTFFDSGEYEQHILDNASFVSRVEASSSPFSTTLKVRIVPKTPAHAYRGAESNNSQWIAEDGTLISLTEEQISDMGSETPPTVITDTTGVNYADGDPILPVSTLDFIRRTTLELSLAGTEVAGYIINDSPREVRFDLAGEGYDLILSVERPIESQVEDYATAVTEITTNKRVVSEYIDLRVVDKVFYR